MDFDATELNTSILQVDTVCKQIFGIAHTFWGQVGLDPFQIQTKFFHLFGILGYHLIIKGQVMVTSNDNFVFVG